MADRDSRLMDAIPMTAMWDPATAALDEPGDCGTGALILGPRRPVERATTRPPVAGRVGAMIRWVVTLGATGVSMVVLDVVATVVGAILVASNLFDGTSQGVVIGFLAVTYLLWAAGLRANVVANWGLLEQTGTSTNLPSKVMFELVRCRASTPTAPRVASAIGYVGTEIAKEAPYYAGAFGTALVSDAVTSLDALVFIAGTNIGAGAYEYGVARLSRVVLDRRAPR